MSYRRVIPRDLFNEADLLKCIGRLWVVTEDCYRVAWENDGYAFEVSQNQDDGSISIDNVTLILGGVRCDLRRPLNARAGWPLYLTREGEDEIRVFDESGALSPEMRAALA